MRILIVLFLSGCMNWESLPKLYRITDSGAVVEIGDAAQPSEDGWTDVDGTTVTDGAVAPDMACAMTYTHTNGLGASWTDCVPLGVHNDVQAFKACSASTDPSMCRYPAAGGSCYQKGVFAGSYTWIYAGSFAGELVTGDCYLTLTQMNWN